MRYFLEFSYKGTNYRGWQIQDNAPTVQAEIDKSISLILRKPLQTTGSSRTDAGVHAEQQYLHFETDLEFNPSFVYRLNKILPNDILIKRIIPVPNDFHCRFDATHRAYEYRIAHEKKPFLENLYYEIPQRPDIEKMNQAAQILIGTHDFQSFSKVHTDVYTFVCTISEAKWYYKNDMLIFSIQSNRFLRGMVRTIVGTLLDVGFKKIDIERFKSIIEKKDRKLAGRSVPAHGLFLTEVGYEKYV